MNQVFTMQPPFELVTLDRDSAQKLKELQFRHYTGKLIFYYSEGHILSVREEELKDG